MVTIFRRRQLLIPFAFGLLLSPTSACKKKAPNGVLVFADGFLTPVSLKVNADGSLSNPGDPGWIILFRTDGQTPEKQSGKAGSVYRIDENRKLVKIGEFDIKKTNAQLAEEFQ